MALQIYKVHITLKPDSYVRLYLDENRKVWLTIIWTYDKVRSNTSSSVYIDGKISERLFVEKISRSCDALYIDLEVRIDEHNIQFAVKDLVTGQMGVSSGYKFGFLNCELVDAEITYIHKADTVETLARARRKELLKQKIMDAEEANL